MNRLSSASVLNAFMTRRSPAQSFTARQKLELVQALRGMAALLVILFHATELSREKLGQPFLAGVFQFGDAGVNFFFVLSGFIIYFVHRSDIGRRERLKPFLLKRLIRIYPFYWAITLVLLPVYFLVPDFGNGYERNFSVIVKSLLLIPQDHFPVLIVGWSLSYELLFYGLFALTIALRPRVAKPLVIGWLVISLLVLLVSSNGLLNLEDNLPLRFVFSLHSLEFGLGFLAGYVVSQFHLRSGLLLLLTGSSLFLLTGIQQPHPSAVDRLFSYGIASTLILLGAASLDLRQSFKSPRLLSYLGDASYSLYLTHYPCLSALLKLAIGLSLPTLLGSNAVTLLIVMISGVIGCLIFSWVEQPMITVLRQRLFPKTSANPS